MVLHVARGVGDLRRLRRPDRRGAGEGRRQGRYNCSGPIADAHVRALLSVEVTSLTAISPLHSGALRLRREPRHGQSRIVKVPKMSLSLVEAVLLRVFV